MIYTQQARSIPPYTNTQAYDKFTRLDNQPVFLYDELDSTVHGVEPVDAFNEQVWAELRVNPEARLLINFPGDFLNLHDISKLKLAQEQHSIPADRIWVIVMDANVVDFVEQRWQGVRVCAYNLLLARIQIPHVGNPGDQRFSVLSRNYRPWRLEFYLHLLKAGVLDRTVYSFHNIDPYLTGKSIYTAEDLYNDARNAGFDIKDSQLRNWFAGIPYDLPNSNKFNKHHNATYDAIRRAGVHLLIESHFDPYIYWPSYRHMDPREFSPGFPTEKTYKAMACARPFIAVTTPYFLESVRALGFKTFSPWIDESYDTIVDNRARMRAIADEVARLNSLDPEEFQTLFYNLSSVILHNYNWVQELQRRNTLPDNWAWLKEHIE